MSPSTRAGTSSINTSSPTTPSSTTSTSSSATARPGNVSPAVNKDSPVADSPQALRQQIARNLNASLPASRSTSPQPSRNSSPIQQKSGQQAQIVQTHAQSTDGQLKAKQDNEDGSAPGIAVRPPYAMGTASTQSLPATTDYKASSSRSTPTGEMPSSKLPRSTQTLLVAPTPDLGSPSPATSITSRSRASPPNSNASSRRASLQRKPDPLMIAPAVTLQTSTPPASATTETGSAHPFDQDLSATSSKTHTRGPSGKSTLETVIEGTPPAPNALAKALEQSITSSKLRRGSGDRGSTAGGKPMSEELTERSESEGNLSDRRGRKKEPVSLGSLKARPGATKTAPPPTPRTKQAENTRNMTVETETVTSIPHSAINTDRGIRREDTGGSVKLESSYETMRPKREKKRTSRKPAPIHNGTASSKADIFEARVASVVDEADSSDSDETFVYESNPPDAGHPRSSRHHSRTPSTASINSLSERRHYGNMGTHRVSGKRSMKFSNNSYNPKGDSPPDGETGSIRTHQPRHISRFGRTMGSHTSLHGPDSPFTQANKIRVNLADTGHLTPGSNTPRGGPKTAPLPRIRGVGGSAQWSAKSAGYRPDFGDGYSDDEELPLLSAAGTVRTPRSARYTRARTGGRRSLERIYSYQQRSRLGRNSACWIAGIALVLLLLFSASGFSIMSNKSLYGVEIKQIENVLASEQELMLDLLVGAVNPNFVDVKITDMDVNVFAKSAYVNPDKNSTGNVMSSIEKRSKKHGNKPAVPGTPWQDPDGRWGDDHEGLEGDAQTMLLGRIYHFDQALYFEGSPFRRQEGQSVGEMRLAKPGNTTESGGSSRWERVLQHPFQLILRGVLKYQVPVTGRGESAAIYGSVIVHPEEGLDAYGNMKVEQVEHLDHLEQWQWIE